MIMALAYPFATTAAGLALALCWSVEEYASARAIRALGRDVDDVA